MLALAFMAANSVMNAFKFDYGYLRRHFERLITQAENLAAVSASSKPVPFQTHHGSDPGHPNFHLFEKLQPTVGVGNEQTDQAGQEAGNYLLNYDFIEPGKIGMQPTAGEYQVKSGILKFAYSKVNYELEGGLLPKNYDVESILESAQPIEIVGDEVGELEIRLKLNNTKRMVFVWMNNTSRDLIIDNLENPINQGRGYCSFSVVPDGHFHTYRVDLRATMKETRVHKEPIRKSFLVPVDVEHDEIEVDYLRLTSRKAKFQNERFGMVYEKIGKANRRAIYIRTPLVLTYDISIPVNQPILKFGLGILDETQPIQFIIRINLNGIEKELYALSVSDSNRWQDARIDMSEYAGKQVELSVSADGGRNAIGFWSDPILYSPPAKKLNIILVMEDALRADHMSCYGYNRKTTPVKDVWAQKGVLFLNAYSQATYTKPSCASLMTSLYPSATGVLNYFDILHENYLTMAEILRNKGFATGSFTQNIFTGPAGGMHQGFGSVFDWETIGIYANTIYKGPDLMEWIAQNSGYSLPPIERFRSAGSLPAAPGASLRAASACGCCTRCRHTRPRRPGRRAPQMPTQSR